MTDIECSGSLTLPKLMNLWKSFKWPLTLQWAPHPLNLATKGSNSGKRLTFSFFVNIGFC